MRKLPILLFAAATVAVPALAEGDALELTRWRGTELDSPVASVSPAIRDAHATLVCWADGIQRIVPHYEGGDRMRSATLHIHNEACGIDSLDLEFVTRPSAAYTVMELTSPVLADTPIAGYPEAKLLLSIVDAHLNPTQGGVREPLLTFRMILEHRYDYDPSHYGDSVVTYETVHGWREVSTEIVGTRVVDRPEPCDPHVPTGSCRMTITTYRRITANTLTGERRTMQFDVTRETPIF